MAVTHTVIPEVLVIEPQVYRDARGFFLETYHAERYRALGMNRPFVQDNHSRSTAGTIRGLHLQVSRPQAKLVRVIAGAVFDVAVDVRRGSPTFGQWVSVELTADNFKQCYIPEGFAHGFAVLSPHAEIEYKCTALYDPGSEVGVAWDDPAIGITWPLDRPPLLSDRDRAHPVLAAQMDRLPIYQPDSRHNR
jgi:dTDP-4-dehydrorhamnose 3,5-epimerase